MRFHRYSTPDATLTADIAITRGTGDEQETTFGRLTGSQTLYLLKETGRTLPPDPADGPMAGPYPEEVWVVAAVGTARKRMGTPAAADIARLLDAACEQAWAEYDRWQQAERAMGDPYP